MNSHERRLADEGITNDVIFHFLMWLSDKGYEITDFEQGQPQNKELLLNKYLDENYESTDQEDKRQRYYPEVPDEGSSGV